MIHIRPNGYRWLFCGVHETNVTRGDKVASVEDWKRTSGGFTYCTLCVCRARKYA